MRLLRHLVAEEQGRRQSDRGNERKECGAKAGRQKGGSEHEGHARVANLPLVLDRVAANDDESENGDPRADADRGAADTMRG